jgi:molybdenum cofactor cytidylyltransferase
LLAAVILSGGASSRMGSPKALLRYRGRTFLEHLLAVTIHPRIGVRRVVLGAHAQLTTTAIALPADEIVINEEWRKGKLSSLHAALRSLPEGTEGLLLCLVDQPLVSAELVDELIETFYVSKKPIVLPICDGRRGHPVIFSQELYPELLAAPLEIGARAVVWAHSQEIAEVPTRDEGCLLNINDPTAFARLTSSQGCLE